MLFTRLDFSGLSPRNRVVMPPMASVFPEVPDGEGAIADGAPSPATIAYYRDRAGRGPGIIIVEHTYVTRSGKAHKGQLGLDDDSSISAFGELATGIRSQGAVAVLQISHVGAGGNPEVTGGPPLGPSEIPPPRAKFTPTPMSEDQIHETQRHFALAARRAQLAGFDGVEIHSAHGYLSSQFLSPLTNNRKDKYGGSVENRARFLLETVAAVKAEVGSEFVVFVRLGSTDGIEGGLTYEHAAETARMLEDAGVALIDISGNYASSRPPGAEPGYFVPAAAEIKKVVKVPVIVTGGIVEGSFAESVLQEGKADLIGVGRAMLRDKDWVSHAKQSLNA